MRSIREDVPSPRASHRSSVDFVAAARGVAAAAAARAGEEDRDDGFPAADVAELARTVAEAALAQARLRCRDLPQVRFERLRAPGEWPPGRFDLILLSEVVYYLDSGDVGRLVERVRSTVEPEGDVVLVHWTAETHYPLSGDEAAELFIAGSRPFASTRHQARTDAYRLDVLRVSGPAQRGDHP